MERAFSLKHIQGKQKLKSNNALNDPSFPSSAYDYLKHVKDEASKCPDVVVADVDYSHFDANQDSIPVPDPLNSSNDIKPSAEWQDEQISAFSEIRQFLVHHQALMKKQKDKIQKILLPPAENGSQWLTFCFGQQNGKCVGNNGPKIIPENERSISVDRMEGNPALLSIICKMNQPCVLSVLDHHISWLETRPFSLLQGQWVYALLAAVEKPLLADTTYSLRCLARLCSQQKDKLTPSQNAEIAALHLIITIVTKYFGQSDLERPT